MKIGPFTVVAASCSLLLACGGETETPDIDPQQHAPESLAFRQISRFTTTNETIAPSAPVLAGATISLVATSPTLSTNLSARSRDPNVLDIDRSEVLCACSSKSDSPSRTPRSIAPAQSCGADESRACSVSIYAHAKAAGDTAVDIVDDAQDVLDAFDVHVRNPAQLEGIVRFPEHEGLLPSGVGPGLPAGADGTFDIPLGRSAEIGAIARDERGAQLHWLTGGIAFTRDSAEAGGFDSLPTLTTDFALARATTEGSASFLFMTNGAAPVTTTVTLRAVP